MSERRAREGTKTYASVPRPEPSRPVPCALCGGASFSRLWNCGTFSFSRCRGCGLVQQNPQPLAEAVAVRYDLAYLEYESRNQEAYRDLELKALEDLGLEKAAAGLKARAAASGRRAAALDVGCATGALLDAFRSRGWEPRGVEICAPMAEFGRSRYRVPIHAGTLESAAFSGGSFELVHASHLIEHLNEPVSFLVEAGRVLAPGGILVLTTPNAAGFQAGLLGRRWRSAIYDHLYLFSRDSLVSLLERRGFRVEAEVTWGGWARGLPFAFAKPALDTWAKASGRGDVMALLARKAAATAATT